MKICTIYSCELCEMAFMDKGSCEAHEATHYGITHRQYLIWERLHKEASNAGKRLGCGKNPDTDKAFDDAIKALVDFEKLIFPHEVKRPSNWR